MREIASLSTQYSHKPLNHLHHVIVYVVDHPGVVAGVSPVGVVRFFIVVAPELRKLQSINVS